jgi:uncharacterized membrane protein YkvA (DUF1232 family)
MIKLIKSQWPIMVFALMFFVLPMSTIPGLFNFIFVILGGFTLVIVGLLIAALVTSKSQVTNGQ